MLSIIEQKMSSDMTEKSGQEISRKAEPVTLLALTTRMTRDEVQDATYSTAKNWKSRPTLGPYLAARLCELMRV